MKNRQNYNDLLKELEGICKAKYIRNSEIAKVFDMGQATIDDLTLSMKKRYLM